MRIVLTMLLALSPGASPGARPQCPTPSADAAISAVRGLNLQYIDAARAHDVRWFDAHLSPEFVVILGTGRRLMKAEFLKLLADEPADYKSLTVRDVKLRRFGATVQVDAEAPWEKLDGKAGVTRYIDTYAWIDCRWQVISAQITWMPPAPGGAPQARSATRVVEIRSYNLKPHTRDGFTARFERDVLPLLRDAKVDVVAYGPSPLDETSWFLMRSYASIEDLQRSEDAFYGSDAWRHGPREAVLADIASYATVVVNVDDEILRGLRSLPSSSRRP